MNNLTIRGDLARRFWGLVAGRCWGIDGDVVAVATACAGDRVLARCAELWRDGADASPLTVDGRVEALIIAHDETMAERLARLAQCELAKERPALASRTLRRIEGGFSL